ncbi:MAG: alpha/beta hydrolase [Chloroflexi bacterium]|nr:alpha/beta hydrolase [Chloroflexota bacterium]
MEITRKTIEVNSQQERIRTSVITAGESGPVVVLLHGGGTDNASLSWGLLIPELAKTHRVIAFDWPGYGESDRHRHIRYTSEFFIQFLHDLLDTLGIPSASFAGLSMGGMAAIGFALRWPERVEKLALVDSYGLQPALDYHKLYYLYMKIPFVNELTWWLSGSRPMMRLVLKGLLRRPEALTEALFEEVYQAMKHPGGHHAWFFFQNHEMTWKGQRTCFMKRLGEISAPTLIVHGTKDNAVPAKYAVEAHERIRGSKLYWMEGCGHWPQRDNPEEFNRVMKSFFCDDAVS